MERDMKPAARRFLDALFASRIFRRHRHRKRGTTYLEIGRGEVQSDLPIREGDALVVYLAEDGKLWLRPPSEFDDGRFELLDP